MPVRQRRHRAGRVTEHFIARLEPRRRRPPARGQARVEQLVVCRPMIPDGDRRDGAESRGVEGEVSAVGPLDDDVVRVFVLRQDVGHRTRRMLRAQPGHHVVERALLSQLVLEVRELVRSNCARAGDWDVSHRSLSIRSLPSSSVTAPFSPTVRR